MNYVCQSKKMTKFYDYINNIVNVNIFISIIVNIEC